jgi:hypothetical protein
MIKIATGMLFFGLILLQSPIPARKSERESNGFVGPVKRAHEFDGNSNNPRSTTTYTDYELNPQGDWIKRKETRQETGGRTYVAIQYRRIEYYPAKK